CSPTAGRSSSRRYSAQQLNGLLSAEVAAFMCYKKSEQGTDARLLPCALGDWLPGGGAQAAALETKLTKGQDAYGGACRHFRDGTGEQAKVKREGSIIGKQRSDDF